VLYFQIELEDGVDTYCGSNAGLVQQGSILDRTSASVSPKLDLLDLIFTLSAIGPRCCKNTAKIHEETDLALLLIKSIKIPRMGLPGVAIEHCTQPDVACIHKKGSCDLMPSRSSSFYSHCRHSPEYHPIP
jgi:hypothetical protein